MQNNEDFIYVGTCMDLSKIPPPPPSPPPSPPPPPPPPSYPSLCLSYCSSSLNDSLLCNDPNFACIVPFETNSSATSTSDNSTVIRRQMRGAGGGGGGHGGGGGGHSSHRHHTGLKYGGGGLPAGYQYRYGGNGVVEGVLIGGVLGAAYSHGNDNGTYYGNKPDGGYFYGYCVPSNIFDSTSGLVSDKDGVIGRNSNSSSSDPNYSASEGRNGSSSSGSTSTLTNSTAPLYPACSFKTNNTSVGNATVCPSGSLCFVPAQGRNSMEAETAVGVCIPTDKCDPTAWDYESYYFSYDPYSYTYDTYKGAHSISTCCYLSLALYLLVLLLQYSN